MPACPIELAIVILFVAKSSTVLRYMRRIGHYVRCIHDCVTITVLATGDIQRSERQQCA